MVPRPVLLVALLGLVYAGAPLGARGGPQRAVTIPDTPPPSDRAVAPPALPLPPAGQDAAPALDPTAFAAFLETLKAEAVAAGIDQATVARALDGLEPLPVVVERDRTQAETVLTIDQYVTRRLTPAVIRRGRQMAATHKATLSKVQKRYDVQARFLVAVWGLESNFGRFSGVRPTVQALATLAFDGRRAALFKGELFDALRILEHGHIDLASMKGSWAGAMGQPQFMPSSYLKYAEDFDGDGRRDIWSSAPDVFASVARYLKEHGWDGDATWGRQVRLPDRSVAEKAGLRETGCRAERQMSPPRPLAAWHADGVRTASGGPLPRVDRAASLMDAGGRYFLVYGNYEALLGYNCAHPYALSVALLADRLSSR